MAPRKPAFEGRTVQWRKSKSELVACTIISVGSDGETCELAPHTGRPARKKNVAYGGASLKRKGDELDVGTWATEEQVQKVSS